MSKRSLSHYCHCGGGKDHDQWQAPEGPFGRKGKEGKGKRVEKKSYP